MDDSTNRNPLPIEEIQRDTLGDFVIFSIKYEYFKKNSVQQAIRNLNKAVKEVERLKIQEHLPFLADIEKNKYTDNVDYGDESWENIHPPPSPERLASPEVVSPQPKRAKKGSTSEEPGPSQGTFEDSQRMDIPSPDHDSDTSSILKENDAVRGNEKTIIHGKDVTLHYRKCADTELTAMKKECNEQWRPSDILTILSIRRITPTRSIRLPIDIIRVTLGYRKITIRMRKENEGSWLETKYMSTKNECFVWYGDTVRYDDQYKYQSLAAKDYFYVVKNKEMEFEELKFDIEDYTRRSVPVWPFESFFGKIRNYLRRFKIKLRTYMFSMMIFKPRGVEDPKKAIATNTVHPFLEENEAYLVHTFEIDIWDDEQLFEDRNEPPVFVTGLVTELERFKDEKPVYYSWHKAIRIKFNVSHYEWSAEQFAALECHNYIEMTLKQDKFTELIKGFSSVKHIPFYGPTTFIVGEHFDLEAAKKVIDDAIEKGDETFERRRENEYYMKTNEVIVELKDDDPEEEGKLIHFWPTFEASSLNSCYNSPRKSVEEP